MLEGLRSGRLLANHWVRRLTVRPPALDRDYTMADYRNFMRAEIFRFSPRYARRRVRIDVSSSALDAIRHHGAVLGFLHYGSFFLSGGALVHQLGVKYTATVTARNLTTDVLSPAELRYWCFVHRVASRLYRNPLFYSTDSPRRSVQWLRGGGALGVALDVREYGHQYREAPFEVLGQQVRMQYGAARLARLAGVPFIPMSIRYEVLERRHRLRIGEPVDLAEPVEATQQALDVLGRDLAEQPQQLFHRLEGFAVPAEAA